MKVRNLKNTSDRSCKCKSWMNHWENHHPGAGIAIFCSEKGCGRVTDLVGAHVKKHDSSDGAWYIVPLCKQHNAAEHIIELASYATLVPANKILTCAKK